MFVYGAKLSLWKYNGDLSFSDSENTTIHVNRCSNHFFSKNTDSLITSINNPTHPLTHTHTATSPQMVVRLMALLLGKGREACNALHLGTFFSKRGYTLTTIWVMQCTGHHGSSYTLATTLGVVWCMGHHGCVFLD